MIMCIYPMTFADEEALHLHLSLLCLEILDETTIERLDILMEFNK